MTTQEQMAVIISAFKLDITTERFCGRCVHCNSDDWHSINREEAAATGRVMERTLQVYTDFWLCGGCGKIYWEGTLFEKAVTHFRKFLPENQNSKSSVESDEVPKLPGRLRRDYEELERKGWSQQRIRAQKLRDGVAVCSRQEIYAKLPQPDFDLRQQIEKQSQSETSSMNLALSEEQE
jgi:hypothetical protein